MLKSTVEKNKAKKGKQSVDGIGKVKFSTSHPEMSQRQEDGTEHQVGGVETWTAEADLWLELTSEVRVAKDCIAEAGQKRIENGNFIRH